MGPTISRAMPLPYYTTDRCGDASNGPLGCKAVGTWHEGRGGLRRTGPKCGNARLRSGEPFRGWMKKPAWLASQRMDYRWGNVQRFVDDLEAAA